MGGWLGGWVGGWVCMLLGGYECVVVGGGGEGGKGALRVVGLTWWTCDSYYLRGRFYIIERWVSYT